MGTRANAELNKEKESLIKKFNEECKLSRTGSAY